MTPFEHLMHQLEHGILADADRIKVDIEELASVLYELKAYKEDEKNGINAG